MDGVALFHAKVNCSNCTPSHSCMFKLQWKLKLKIESHLKIKAENLFEVGIKDLWGKKICEMGSF